MLCKMLQIFSGRKHWTKMNHEILELRELYEQLRIEVNVEPIQVSDALKDLMQFIEANKESDKLVVGFTSAKDNPFSEANNGGCIVI